jgi:hypothetical protein
MSTSASKPKRTTAKSSPVSLRAFVPTSALAKSITFDDAMMHVSLTDGRIVGVPLAWFPALLRAKPEQLRKYEIGGGGISLHWPALDEDLSVANLLAGADTRST